MKTLEEYAISRIETLEEQVQELKLLLGIARHEHKQKETIIQTLREHTEEKDNYICVYVWKSDKHYETIKNTLIGEPKEETKETKENE